MKVDMLVADIGSTTTIVNAFDRLSGNPVFLGQGMAPTTVLDGDVTIGLKGAIDELRKKLGEPIEWGRMLATSSAAGGLKMTVHGLVYDMTARAAKEAALGAGAVLKMVTAGELTPTDMEKIKSIKPNIILLAGGVDYGERNTVVKNASHLASLKLPAPVIYAGNVAAADEAIRVLNMAGIKTIPVDNVYPAIDELNIEPTRTVIQDVFEEHIVAAPGMQKIREMVDGSIVPTPGAVMNAAKLLNQDIGDVIVLDVGGATTDVHSVTKGSEEVSKILISPEPEAKRTVEGDLGVYVNARNVIEVIGVEEAKQQLNPIDPENMLEQLLPIPETVEQKKFVEFLTRTAARTALIRHSGKLRNVYGAGGKTTIATGKDLTRVKWIIGTGGAFARLKTGSCILGNLIDDGSRAVHLLPASDTSVLIDSDYIMASIGVMALELPDAALTLMKKSLHLS